jgi:hypothetical protein
MREKRAPYRKLPPLEQWNAKTRTHTHTLIGRGVIEVRPCLRCGGRAEAHHPITGCPYVVVWLCREHHEELHRTGWPFRAFTLDEITVALAKKPGNHVSRETGQ